MDNVTQLKAEIFDLQIEMARVRKAIEDKIAQLNKITKEKKNESGQ